MFTICPHCTKQFHVYAEHIATASGQVRCGFCHEQFNALTNLHDRPLSNEKILKKVHTSLGESTPAATDEHSEKKPADETKEPKAQSNQTTQSISRQTIQDPLPEELKINPHSEDDDELPDFGSFTNQSSKKKKRSKNKKMNLFWAVGSIAMLCMMLLQLTWFNRYWVLVNYPQLMPHAKQICHTLGCQLIRQKNAQSIKLLSRDIRPHLQYKDILLVNAKIKNTLLIRQPYPTVQLTLFDRNGTLLAYRNFIPTEYLGQDIDLDAGMPIDTPIHFVLEVSDPTTNARSFEFRFL